MPRLRRSVIAAVMELAEEVVFAPPPEKPPRRPREVIAARERFQRQLLGGAMAAYASARDQAGEHDADLVPLHGYRKRMHWPKLLMNDSSSPNFDELMNFFIKN